jgi:hypothetical protein
MAFNYTILKTVGFIRFWQAGNKEKLIVMAILPNIGLIAGEERIADMA